MEDVVEADDGLRRWWMSVLARAPLSQIGGLVHRVDLPECEIVKPAECGTIMIEGRAGGGGQRFNAGEATMTRCIVRNGERLGFSYALGRDKEKALLCARIDAALQDVSRRDAIMERVVAPLEQEQRSRREMASRRAAATKVDFFTMVRGEG